MRRDVNWEFKRFTEDLEECADWLMCCGVDTVAMVSTVCTGYPLYGIPTARGLTVNLVNAWQVKCLRSQVRCSQLHVAATVDGLWPADRHFSPDG